MAGLPASKENDMVSKQFMLQKILLKIGGIESRVHRLQERLSKACSKQAKHCFAGASFMDHAQVNVAEKRQRTQKRSYSPTDDRYAKPQKKKKLNILLEQDDRLALSVKPTLSERATDCVKEEPQGGSEEKAAERSQAHKKAITVDLLLGVESTLPNGHLGDLCKENTDDILIDNRGAEEEYQPFGNVKHPLEKPQALPENVAKTGPSKAGNTTSEPAEAEKISVTLVKQEHIVENRPALTIVYSGRKWRRQPRPEDTGSAAAAPKNHSKQASEAPPAKQKAQTTTRAENENAGSKKQKTVDTRSTSKMLSPGNSCSAAKTPKAGKSSSAVKTPKTGNSSSAAKTPKTGNLYAGGKATGNSSPAAKTPKKGNLSSGGNKQATGDKSAAAKKPRTGNVSSSDGKKQTAGNSSAPAARKETSGNLPTNMRIEKAILVEVNSRRSQRVRKPKVY